MVAERSLPPCSTARELIEQPLPGTASHNYAGIRKKKRVREMLRDSANRDFRERTDAVELSDMGMLAEGSVKGEMLDVTNCFLGKAPDIGLYEYGDNAYWIPGRQAAQAFMPVPNGGQPVPLDAGLMYLIGLDGVKSKTYLGGAPDDWALVAVKLHPRNIVSPVEGDLLEAGKTYYWRVDTVMPDGSVVTGDVWGDDRVR